ncbi:hypothetical protein ACP4OV_019226 [Aristida adscensionis]
MKPMRSKTVTFTVAAVKGHWCQERDAGEHGAGAALLHPAGATLQARTQHWDAPLRAPRLSQPHWHRRCSALRPHLREGVIQNSESL